MTDEPFEPDWQGLRIAHITITEMVWSYHQALVAAGFAPDHALPFALAYQEHLWWVTEPEAEDE